jgi:hypothetical protein
VYYERNARKARNLIDEDDRGNDVRSQTAGNSGHDAPVVGISTGKEGTSSVVRGTEGP